ncbi:pullulanase X25 domain-containing protein [Salana multivorans]
MPLAVAAPAAAAVGPDTITAPGSFNSEIGCTGDWQPDCEAAELIQIGTSGVFKGEFALPATTDEPYLFKAAKGGAWDVNWGQWGTPGGGDIPFTTDGSTTYVFYENLTNHAFADKRTDLYTVRGSFQSELGCSGDWDADGCLATTMFPQADGTYRFATNQLPSRLLRVQGRSRHRLGSVLAGRQRPVRDQRERARRHHLRPGDERRRGRGRQPAAARLRDAAGHLARHRDDRLADLARPGRRLLPPRRTPRDRRPPGRPDTRRDRPGLAHPQRLPRPGAAGRRDR